MSVQNDRDKAPNLFPSRHSQQSTSATSSRVQLNKHPTLISLTASRSQVDSIHGSSSRMISEGANPPPLKDYTKDQHLASKPPLPSSVHLHRPPSRNLSQRNSGLAWATITTPRIRVPAPDAFPSPPFISDGRPVSPLSRSFRAPPLEILSFPTSSHSRSSLGKNIDASNSALAANFQYNGPHQVYPGPTSTPSEGPQPLHWPFAQSSDHQLCPPPPPSGILNDMQFPKKPSVVNLAPHHTSSGHVSRTETEQEFLINILNAARQPNTPFVSHRGSMLLTSPPGGSCSTSFPSTQALREMEQASMQNATAVTNSVGPFEDCGIPSQIQDDLLRIEMLLLFRKYKEALNQKIQNQNQILQLVNSRSQLNSQQQQQPQQLSGLVHSSPQQLPHRWHTLSTVMDTPPSFGGSGIPSPSSRGNNVGGGATPDLTEEKPVWPDDIADQFATPNFLLNTFIEPHILPSSLGVNQTQNRNHQQQQQAQQAQHSTNFVTSTSRADKNANDTKSISTLQTRNFDEFQALVEQSRSGFPMGMMQQQNPLLAGAQLFNSASPPYPFTPVPANQRSPADVTRATPLRIQVTPKDASQQQPQQQQGPSNTVQQHYQKYLLDKNKQFESLSPNSFKIMEQVINRDLMTMRKPVAVSFSPKSPVRTSPDGVATPNDSITVNLDNDKMGGGGMDKPSPFFPGFSDGPKMKIKTPEEVHAGDNNKLVAGHNLEGVEELGNLLSQLPVLTRKQKVEEFQLVNTLKPVTPVTEAESETSMIPLVSSTGTLVSEKRPDTVENKLTKIAETDDELFKSVDTNKMSINELVSLGRKIYRILSQLSNNTNTNVGLSPTQTVFTTPMTLNVPSPNTPVFASSNNNKGFGNTSGLTSPQLLVDFNAIPNPSFITGPGLTSTKSTPKLVSSNVSRTRTPTQPPNLFRKVLQPPPTRWGGDTGRQRATAVSNPPPSRQPGFISPRNSQTQQQPVQKKHSRAQFRRSMSSIMSGTISGSVQALTKSETKALLKLAPPSSIQPPVAQRSNTPVRLVNTNPETLPESFTVREKYRNNRSNKNMSKFNQRRQSTPYPYQTGPIESRNVNTATTTPTRGRSVGRRNFIQENISKIRNMKKLPDTTKLRPRPLPPVNKKRYENIPSTIPGSRSRSNSQNNRGEDPRIDSRYRRSSSVPVSNGGYSPYRQQYPVRSVSTPRPSTGMSVHVTSSRSQSSTQQTRPASRIRPASGGLIQRPILSGVSPKTPKPKPSQISTKANGSKVKFGKLPSKTSIGNGDSIRGSNNTLTNARKSRSKTKRLSLVQKKNSQIQQQSRTSSVSSPEQQPVKPKKAQKVKVARVQKVRKGKKLSFGETLSSEEDSPLFNSASEQRMIREMVKAEMNMMVQQHVKNVLKKEQKMSRSRSREKEHEEENPDDHTLSRQQEKHDFDEEVDEGGDTNGMDKGQEQPPPEEDDGLEDIKNSYENDEIESENLTPVYTPPRYYDESLFSLEKWINPEGNSLPGSAYTSAKETPLTTANSNIYGMGGVRKHRFSSKPQTVRFSLPSHAKKSTSK